MNSYDNTSSYGNYNQSSSFKDYQQPLPQQQQPQAQHQPAAPAQPKYSAPANVAPQQPPAAAAHAAYNAGYGHASSAYGSSASPAPSTSAPLPAASNQVSAQTLNSPALAHILGAHCSAWIEAALCQNVVGIPRQAGKECFLWNWSQRSRNMLSRIVSGPSGEDRGGHTAWQ